MITNEEIFAISRECPYKAKNYQKFGGYLVCEDDFDSVLCWPETYAGELAVLPCFSHFNGIRYDTSKNASRLCLPNGTWAKYTDYSQCSELPSLLAQEDHHLTTSVYFGGYAISLVTLAIAVYIFFRYKDLRCLRNKIHVNLMISYIIVDFIWMLTFLLETFLAQNFSSCVFLLISLHYFHLTNFFWMFVEGFYLYVLVVKTFRNDRVKLGVCAIIGWILPAIFVLFWVLAKCFRLYGSDFLESCPWKFDHFDWIFQVPAFLVLFFNALFMIKIMWVLITKLRSNTQSAEAQQYRKAAKALLVLIPLLGITYIVVLMGPTQPGKLKMVYECLRAILISTQGFFVALFYCFLNAEVKTSVAHHLNVWNTHRRISQRSSSRRNQQGSSGRDSSSQRRSRESIRLYQSVKFFKKRESSGSVRTTTSLVTGSNRDSLQKFRSQSLRLPSR